MPLWIKDWAEPLHIVEVPGKFDTKMGKNHSTHRAVGVCTIQRCVSNQIFKYSIPNSGTIWFHGETRNTEKKKSIWYFTITNTDFIWCASNHRALSLNPAPIWQIDFKSSNHIAQNIKWSQFRFDAYYLKWWFDSVFIGFDIGIFK